MRTIKPACSSIMTRCIEHQGKYYLGVSVLTHIPLMGAPRLGAEQALWPMLAKYAPRFIEEAIPRTRSEYLLYGNVYPPKKDAEAVYADFGLRIGELSKKARAFGHRVMQGPRLRVQEPVVPVAIAPEHAYGGPGYAENLLGVGHPSSEQDGNLVLPKIELLSHPWHPDLGTNEAALFDQVDIMHPLRQRLAGTYGDEWLKTDYPGMPEDTNWAVFNTALPDQQQAAAFTGDESFDLVNLSAEFPHISNHLPGIGARVLLRFKGEEAKLQNLKTALRSLVFIPEAGSLAMIWQTQSPISTDDGSDVELIMAGFEHLSRPRSDHHYLAALNARLDDEDGMLASLDESALVPEDMDYDSLLGDLPDLNAPPDPNSFVARQRLRAETDMQRARADVAEQGLDLDEHAPPEHLPPPPVLPPLSELGPYIRKLEEEAEEQRLAGEKRRQEQLEDSAKKYAETGRDFDEIRDEMAGKGTNLGPPKSRKEETLKSLHDVNKQTTEQGEPVDEIQEMLADTDLHQQWEEADQRLLSGYRLGAHHQAPFPRSEGEVADSQRQLVEERLQQGAGLAELDLTGADLSGMDLSGVDCRRVLLESADLRQSNLTGACFAEAVLAHADLRGAQMKACDFQGANLGKAQLDDADASTALFIDAQLGKATFSRTFLQGAVFKDSQWYELNLSQCDLTGADFREAQLLNCNLSGSRFDGVLLDGTQFVDCNVQSTTWKGSKGESVAFVNIDSPGIDFTEAQLPGSRWVGEVNLTDALFINAQLQNAYFGQEATLTGANFEHVKATGSDFTACNLESVMFRGAVLKSASLRKARLLNADFRQADLMEATLQNALLQGAQLLGANLYGADLARIHTDSHTRADGSVLTKARVYPRNQPARPSS